VQGNSGSGSNTERLPEQADDQAGGTGKLREGEDPGTVQRKTGSSHPRV